MHAIDIRKNRNYTEQYDNDAIPVKNMEEISRDDAYSLAKALAARILSGELSAYEGGMKIWKEVVDKLGSKCPDDLWPFKSNSSAIEDIRWNAGQGGDGNEGLIRQCEQEILAAARNLADPALGGIKPDPHRALLRDASVCSETRTVRRK